MGIGRLGAKPHYVEIVPTTTANWGSPSASIAAGSGAPSGNEANASYYFNLSNFDLYRWSGSAWTGPHAFTYSSETPTSNDIDGGDYWVVGANFEVTGGIYGPRTLTTYPADGDTIVWDATAGQWIATAP